MVGCSFCGKVWHVKNVCPYYLNTCPDTAAIDLRDTINDQDMLRFLLKYKFLNSLEKLTKAYESREPLAVCSHLLRMARKDFVNWARTRRTYRMIHCALIYSLIELGEIPNIFLHIPPPGSPAEGA